MPLQDPCRTRFGCESVVCEAKIGVKRMSRASFILILIGEHVATPSAFDSRKVAQPRDVMSIRRAARATRDASCAHETCLKVHRNTRMRASLLKVIDIHAQCARIFFKMRNDTRSAGLSAMKRAGYGDVA